MKTKRVIDADNNKIIDFFDPKFTDEIKERLERLNIWNEISVDRDGDIILWKE